MVTLGAAARPRSRLFAALAAVAAIVLVVDGVRIVDANAARPVSFSQALHRFEQLQAHLPAAQQKPAPQQLRVQTVAQTATKAATTTAATTAATPMGTKTAPAIDPPPTNATTAAPTTSTDPATMAAPSTTTALKTFVLPPAGVYAYRTSGHEQINVPGTSRSYPSQTYATLTHDGGCQWEIDNDVLQQHTDRRRECVSQGGIAQIFQSRSIAFFGTTETYQYNCVPPLSQFLPGDTGGAVHTSDCSDGVGDGAVITITDRGAETVTVGGQAVGVVHLTANSVLTGGVTGSETDDLLVDAVTGVIVHWARTVSSYTKAFGISAHYTEDASFDLESLQPAT